MVRRDTTFRGTLLRGSTREPPAKIHCNIGQGVARFFVGATECSSFGGSNSFRAAKDRTLSKMNVFLNGRWTGRLVCSVRCTHRVLRTVVLCDCSGGQFSETVRRRKEQPRISFLSNESEPSKLRESSVQTSELDPSENPSGIVRPYRSRAILYVRIARPPELVALTTQGSSSCCSRGLFFGATMKEASPAVRQIRGLSKNGLSSSQSRMRCFNGCPS